MLPEPQRTGAGAGAGPPRPCEPRRELAVSPLQLPS
jgi:hypothetical protein